MFVRTAPPREMIEEELERLAASDALRRAPSHQRLLRHLVERRVAGDEAALRELAIALDVFKRDPSTYDPQVDPIVRVSIGRLRERLEAHYANYDHPPKLRIVLPKGRYVPDFVVGADPTAESPAWPALAIPAHVTRLFGIEAQVSSVRELVARNRLVTLMGPGGSGKTRLAVEVAQALRDAAASAGDGGGMDAFDAIAFVALAPCTDVTGMEDALRAAFSLPARSRGVIRQLASALAGRRVLIVLDNLEHLLPAAATLVSSLLTALPRLSVLATSRIVLGHDGEREFRLAPLAAPPPGATPAEASDTPALALFADRARAGRPDFRIDPDNAADVAAIVRTLGGLPLAIELAASRARSFSPREMLQRLRSVANGAPPGSRPGLKLLERTDAGGGTDRRHASMEQVIDWSWRQLDDMQQRTLEAITVFPAGLTAEAAVAVTGDADAGLTLDALVRRSLVAVHAEADDNLRFVITEPVREFVHSQLGHERWQDLRARQRHWCRDWAADLGTTPSLRATQAEMPNVLAAMASAVADGAPEDALWLTVALRPVFNDVPLPPGGVASLRKAVAADGDAGLRAEAFIVLGLCAYNLGEHAQALAEAEAGLSLASAEGPTRARALHAVASLRWRSTRQADGLDALLDEALAIAERCDHPGIQASIHALYGFIAGARRGGEREAEELQRRALALWERQGNRHSINSGHYNLAVRAAARRAWGECLERLQGVCAIARKDQDSSLLSQALNVRGNALAGLREWAAARDAYLEAAEVAFAAANGIALTYALWNIPGTLAHLRQPESAARLMAFAIRHWRAHFGDLSDADRRELRHVRRLVDVQVTAARRVRLEDEGRLLDPRGAMMLLRATTP